MNECLSPPCWPARPPLLPRPAVVARCSASLADDDDLEDALDDVLLEDAPDDALEDADVATAA